MTARGHLRTYGALAGHRLARVEQVLEATGAREYADRRIRGLSTGMRPQAARAWRHRAALVRNQSALILLAYAAAASGIATFVPLRRDIT